MVRQTFICPICKKYRTTDIVFTCIDCDKVVCAYCIKRRKCIKCHDKWVKVHGNEEDKS